MRQPVLIGIALALLVPARASALPPPLPVNARYGPVTQCYNGYRIAVAAGEGLSVGHDVTLVTDRYLLRLSEGGRDGGNSKVSSVTHPSLGAVERVVTTQARSKENGGFRVIGDKRPVRAETVSYRLRALDGGRAVTVHSNQFGGTEADLVILSRVARTNSAADSCGSFAAPDWAGQNFDALRWSPNMAEGPAFRCQNGVGYAVNPGERLRLYWGPQPDTTISELRLADRAFAIRGPTEAAKKQGRAKGPMAAGYGVTKRVIYPGASELILSPPQNDRERPFLRQIFIPHQDIHEAEARALADRLEFVTAKDPRCRSTPR
jgi:hypothetical protein